MSTRKVAELALMDIDLHEVEIPLMGLVAAGQPIEAVSYDRTVSIPQNMLGSYRTFALEVRGDSMIEENIQPGDVIVVEERQTAENGQMVVAMINEADVTLKKFYCDSDGIKLVPANCTMEPIRLRHDQVRVLGVVAGMIRHYRRH